MVIRFFVVIQLLSGAEAKLAGSKKSNQLGSFFNTNIVDFTISDLQREKSSVVLLLMATMDSERSVPTQLPPPQSHYSSFQGFHGPLEGFCNKRDF